MRLLLMPKTAVKVLLLLAFCALPALAEAQSERDKKAESGGNAKQTTGPEKRTRPKKKDKVTRQKPAGKKKSQVDLWLSQKIYRARRFFGESLGTPPGAARAFESTFNPYLIDYIKENVASNAWDDPRIRLEICDGDLVVTQTENVHKRLDEFLTDTITANRQIQIIFNWQVVLVGMKDAHKILGKILSSVTAETKVFPWIGSPVIFDADHYYTLSGKGQKSRRDGWLVLDFTTRQIEALSAEIKKSKRAKIACNVRLTTLSGKSATYNLSRRVNFVSHFEQPPVYEGKRTVLVPSIGSVRTGMWFEMCGFLNEDKSSATIYFRPTLCNLLALESIDVKARIDYLTSDKGKQVTQDVPLQIPLLARRTGLLKADLRNNESVLAVGLTGSVDKDKKFKTEVVLIVLNIGIAPRSLQLTPNPDKPEP